LGNDGNRIAFPSKIGRKFCREFLNSTTVAYTEYSTAGKNVIFEWQHWHKFISKRWLAIKLAWKQTCQIYLRRYKKWRWNAPWVTTDKTCFIHINVPIYVAASELQLQAAVTASSCNW